MIKNILVYRWNSNGEPIVIQNLKNMGYNCIEFKDKFSDYHSDGVFAERVLNCIQSEKIHLVFSWDYFPLLASVCEITGTPYAAWIYNCPLNTLMSKTILYKHNYLFCFDRSYARRLEILGCNKVYHFSLGVDAVRFNETVNQKRDDLSGFSSDISFVGSLYSEKNKWLKTEGIPEYVKGYINGIVEAQFRVYGYNFVKEMIGEDVAREILEKVDLKLNELYFDNPTQLVADFVNEEVTRKERQSVIEIISKRHKMNLYTNSKYAGNDNVQLCGIVDYHTQMPLVFHNSRINLNITSKTIESGIPLRVLDILACGGFCLTNYQPEIAELFEDGTELVMYTSMEDLESKVDWYLQHEQERAAIAEAGYHKVKEDFSIRKKLSEILEIVQGDIQ